MKRLIFTPALAMLAGCATMQGASPSQSIYAAYATYGIALNAAAEYAQSPTASPAIVRHLNAANQRPETKAAVTYGRAYVLCQGNPTTVTPGVDCSIFDFRPATAQAYAITIRAVVAELATRS